MTPLPQDLLQRDQFDHSLSLQSDGQGMMQASSMYPVTNHKTTETLQYRAMIHYRQGKNRDVNEMLAELEMCWSICEDATMPLFGYFFHWCKNGTYLTFKL